ncbi:MAG TPA: DUF192 domain-containing protein [Stellaceae bacterium]|nr:DUF192 domain-containing protein [Stellaceae bacterium]
MMLRPFLLVVVAAGAIALAGCPAGAQLQHFAKSSLVIHSAQGPRRFDIEIAETEPQMEQGLMYRHRLAPDAGMLFIYKQPTVAMFWMKNTLIPLDMLFVDAHGRIVNIHTNAVPESLAIIRAHAPVRAVIELNGGAAALFGIKPGDEVVYPLFGNTR